METKTQNNRFIHVLFLTLSVVAPFLAKAEKSIRDSISDDETNSFYIIGGVLVFGIGFYFVYSMMEKSKKNPRSEGTKRLTHRPHQHHRVVKKSA